MAEVAHQLSLSRKCKQLFYSNNLKPGYFRQALFLYDVETTLILIIYWTQL